jgi:hypothetical protein
MGVSQRSDALAFTARVRFKQVDQCACAQLERSGHRLVWWCEKAQFTKSAALRLTAGTSLVI